MKEILDEDSRKALITYRLQRAYETLKEAEVRFIMHLLIVCIMLVIMQQSLFY